MKSDARVVGDLSVEAGRGPGQLPWYEFASRIFAGKSILDVGCGLGKGLEILRKTSSRVIGQDLDPRLAGENIIIGALENIESKSFDIVTSIDVIEHVADDHGFVSQLCRIAREGVFVTTPNWTITRCQWPYHLREYTPRELYQMFKTYGQVKLLKGNSSGSVVYDVDSPELYFWVNDLRSMPVASLLVRAGSKLLPLKYRIHGHLAAQVLLQ